MSDLYRDSIFWVEVERIKPNPFQPRREFDQSKLEELAESIRMYGLLQPLTVTRKEEEHPDGGISVTYELIAGERRLRASKIAGVSQVPVIIRSGEDDDQVKLELAIIENLQREDLNPVDRAQAFHRLYKDFGFTHAQIGKKMGKSREYVSNTLRLLSLPEAILTYLAEGRMTEGHTRPLLMLNSKPEEQMVLAREVVMKKFTVRETENIARRSAQDRVTARHKIDPSIISVEQAITERLGTRVTIEPREVGGRLVISFFSAEDLQGLLDAMRVEDERAMVSPDLFKAVQQEEQAEAAAQEDVQQSEEVVVTTEKEQEGVEEESVEGTHTDSEAAEVTQPEQGVDRIVQPEAVPEAAESRQEPEQEEEKPKEEELSAFETFMRVLTGHGPEKVEEEKVERTDAGIEQGNEEQGAVTPSPKRPMPEQTEKLIEVPLATEELKVEAEPKVAEEPKEERRVEKKEDDADLYSIRNFSI